MKPDKDILEKIEKILALAHKKSGATDAERATAQKMADEMMARYGLRVNTKSYQLDEIRLQFVPEATEAQKEALWRAMNHVSFYNFATIISGFIEKGIDVDDIIPRQNVFTFDAWKALGRFVRKGEKSVRIFTLKPVFERGDDGKEIKPKKIIGKRPGKAYVFHLSQTDAIRPEYAGFIA